MIVHEDGATWGIHAGKTGDAESLFMKKRVVALGWRQMGDLSRLKSNREAFKKAFAEAILDAKPGAVATSAGQMYRFLYELKREDLVLYSSKRDRHIHYARVTGEYAYSPEPESTYPHHREVEWIAKFPRTRFSQGALYEIGSALSFFQIKNYAEEYRAALEGKPTPLPDEGDDTGAPDASEIESITRDFVLKRLAQDLKGHPLAALVGHLLHLLGYRTRVSPAGADGGVDIVAHKDELGFEPPIVKVQVKSGEGSVGDPVVSALYGKVGASEFGLLVTLGDFTNQARTFAKSKSNLRLIDGDELVDLLLENYERLDSRYKGLIPLRKVWVPEALSEGSEA
ncbi:MAG: restriction endonuclease [Thermoanaerobaculia bacterium]|nr:MAG: restriction endonuclease [Thermoanaerobaculia bacterium]